MKRSTLMHGTAIVTGTWGMLSLLAAWFAGEGGTFLGFSQLHLFTDAIILQLIAISAGVCALYRLSRENK